MVEGSDASRHGGMFSLSLPPVTCLEHPQEPLQFQGLDAIALSCHLQTLLLLVVSSFRI